MDVEITLLEANLNDSHASLVDPNLLQRGGYASLKPTIHHTTPLFYDDEDIAHIECMVHLEIQGLLGSEESKEDIPNEVVFYIDVRYSGLFEVKDVAAKNFQSDSDFRVALLGRFANQIFPLQRNHVMELMTSMGVRNANLPWHIDLDLVEFVDHSMPVEEN